MTKDSSPEYEKQLLELKKTLKSFISGDYAARMNTTGNNEALDELVNELNALGNQLQQTGGHEKRADQNYQAMLKANPDVIFRLSRTGDIIDFHANPGTLVHPEVSFKDSNITDHMPKVYGEECIRLIAKTLETGDIQFFHHHTIYEGRLHYFEGRLVLNGLAEVLLIVRDVTEAKKTENINKLMNKVALMAGDSNVSVAEFCQCVEEELKNFLKISEFYIARTSRQGELTFLHLSNERFNGQIQFTRSNGNGFSEYVVRTGEPLLLRGSEIYAFKSDHRLDFYGEKAACWMGAPLTAYGKTVGVVVCQSNQEENLYGPEDLELLSLVGGQIGVWVNKKIIEEHEKSMINIFENSLNEIYIFSASNFQFRFVNQGGRKNLGYNLEELKGLTPLDIKEDYTVEDFREIVQPLSDGDIPVIVFETNHKRKDGSKYPVEVHLTRTEYRGEDAFVAIILDITERKKAEKSLKEYERFFNDSIELMCIADTSGYFRKINRAFSRVLGYTREELLSTKFVDFVHPDDLEATFEEVSKLSEGIPTISFTNRYRCKDGSYKWINWTSSPDLQTGLLYSTARDITNMVETNEKINTANKELQLVDQVYQALMQSNPFDELVSLTMDAMPKLVHFHTGRFYMYDSAAHSLVLKDERLNSGLAKKIENRTGKKLDTLIPNIREGAALYEAIREQRIVVVKDPKEIKEILEDHTDNIVIKRLAGWVKKLLNINSLVIVPLVAEKEILGLVTIASDTIVSDLEVERIKRFTNGVTAALAKSFAEQEVHKNKKFVEDVLNNLPAEVAVFDKQHIYQFVNKAAVSDKEVRDWLIGKDDFDYCAENDIDEAIALKRRAFFDEVLRTKTPISWVDKYESGKEEKHVLRNLSPVYNGDELKHMIGYGVDITSRMLAEKKNKRLASIVSRSNDSIVSIDRDLKVVSWNTAATRMYGYTVDEMIGEDIARVIPFDQLDEFLHLFSLVINEGESVITESVRRTRDGKRIDVSLSIFPLKNEEGDIIGASGITRDITYKKASEQALIQSESKLREAQRIARIGNWECNVETNVLVWSDEMYNIFELYKDEIELSSEIFQNSIHEEDRELVLEKIKLAQENKQGYEIVYRVNTSSGKVKYVEDIGNVEVDTDGTVLRLYGTTMDVTERVRAERVQEEFTLQLENMVNERTRELKVSQNELKYQLDTLNQIALVSITDTDGNITYVNDIFCEVSGYSKEELIGDSHRLIKSGEQPDILFVRMWKKISRGLVWKGEIVNKAKDGTLYWVNTTIVPFFNIDGEIEKYVAVQFEITQEKWMQEKLKEALDEQMALGELKSRFVSTASHQFRTPLTVIQSSMGLLEMHSENVAADSKKILDKVITRTTREVQRMTNIMNEVLILEKISAGGITPVFADTGLLEICEEVLEEYNQIQEDGRVAELKVVGSPKQIQIDKNLFEQAFSNMLSNAFKYSKGRPAPEVLMEFDDEKIHIEVRDFGMGIPEEDIKKLFTPFYRASNVLDIAGTGLGTSIMKEYIEINQGKLWVESKVGKGTVIHVEFNK